MNKDFTLFFFQPSRGRWSERAENGVQERSGGICHLGSVSALVRGWKDGDGVKVGGYWCNPQAFPICLQPHYRVTLSAP